ncbi:MAG: protein TolQ [Pelagibacterales bacterium]|nr:protein TolQ [Pelagibacterales bacterium]
MMDPVSAKVVGLSASSFSFFHLFIRADFIVKAVIIILIAASIYSWAVIIEKYKLFKRIQKSAEIFEDQFFEAKSADALYKKVEGVDDPMINVFKSGIEYMMKHRRVSDQSEKVMHHMHNAIDNEMEKIEKRLTFLATVGSTAPFIGLFGTVWGIMNSFQSIAISKNTSLAIVAPGIAEALFATALGLLAAIPAVVAYNKFASDSRKYLNKLENFTQSFSSAV